MPSGGLEATEDGWRIPRENKLFLGSFLKVVSYPPHIWFQFISTVRAFVITVFAECVQSHSVMSNCATPRTVDPPGSSVHGILQGRIPEWVAPGGLQLMGSQRVGHDWPTNRTVNKKSGISTGLEKQELQWFKWCLCFAFPILLNLAFCVYTLYHLKLSKPLYLPLGL